MPLKGVLRNCAPAWYAGNDPSPKRRQEAPSLLPVCEDDPSVLLENACPIGAPALAGDDPEVRRSTRSEAVVLLSSGFPRMQGVNYDVHF